MGTDGMIDLLDAYTTSLISAIWLAALTYLALWTADRRGMR